MDKASEKWVDGIEAMRLEMQGKARRTGRRDDQGRELVAFFLPRDAK